MRGESVKALLVGSGGVGELTAAIARRRDPRGELFQTMVMADQFFNETDEIGARDGADWGGAK
jgi:hypothetical protein